MNKFYATLAALFILKSVVAQKVVIEETKDNFAQGNVNVYKVSIPYTPLKQIENEWKKNLKEKEAKVSENENIVFADNTAIKEFGTNTCDIYTRYQEKKDVGVVMTVAYDMGGKYLSCENDTQRCRIAKAQLKQFALGLAMASINDILKEENKKNEKLKAQQKELVEKNTDLKASVEAYKTKIAKTLKSKSKLSE